MKGKKVTLRKRHEVQTFKISDYMKIFGTQKGEKSEDFRINQTEKSKKSEMGWTCFKTRRKSSRYRAYTQNFDEDRTPERRRLRLI